MPKTDDELLNDALDAGAGQHPYMPGISGKSPSSNAEMASPTHPDNVEYRQWQIGPNDTFRPAGLTRERLAPAVYQFDEDNYGLVIRKISVITDSLTPLPDTANERVLEGMKIFWERQDKYKEHGLLYIYEIAARMHGVQ